ARASAGPGGGAVLRGPPTCKVSGAPRLLRGRAPRLLPSPRRRPRPRACPVPEPRVKELAKTGQREWEVRYEDSADDGDPGRGESGRRQEGLLDADRHRLQEPRRQPEPPVQLPPRGSREHHHPGPRAAGQGRSRRRRGWRRRLERPRAGRPPGRLVLSPFSRGVVIEREEAMDWLPTDDSSPLEAA